MGARHALKTGMEQTYQWIERQYADRKAGRRVVQDEIGVHATR